MIKSRGYGGEKDHRRISGSFYESAGFINYEPHYPWTKEL